MKPSIVVPALVLMVIAIFLVSSRTIVSTSSMTIAELDYTSMAYHPINYAADDILNYEYHAFLRFDHPLVFTGIEYLNVKVGIPGDSSEGWLVKNIPLADNFEARPIHYRMDMLQLSLAGRPDTVLLMPKVGAFQTSSGFIPDTSFIRVGADFVHHVPPSQHSVHYPVKIPYFPILDTPVIVPILIEYLNRGCDVPNIDLDASLFPDTDPLDGIGDGDYNACGPAATANSMSWLMESDDRIPDTLTTDELLDTLKILMRKLEDTIMITPNPDNPEENDTTIFGGTPWPQMVMGKLHLIDQYKLPINVKYQVHSPPGMNDFPKIDSPDSTYGHHAENQTGPTHVPDFEWICNEIKEGEDVELVVDYWCRVPGTDSMAFNVAHVVNVIGYASFGNERRLMWKHDTDHTQTSGMNLVEEYGSWRMASRPNDSMPNAPQYPVIAELSDTSQNGCVAYIGSVISESYDSTLRFCPKNISSTADNGEGSLRQAIACAREGDTITLLSSLRGDTIHLTSLPLTVDSAIVICADPGDTIFVSAATIDRAFQINSMVELKGFIIIGGTSTEGAAIRNDGTLELKDINIFPNTPGATDRTLVENNGMLTVTGATNVRNE